jgi:hypothetical protein
VFPVLITSADAHLPAALTLADVARDIVLRIETTAAILAAVMAADALVAAVFALDPFHLATFAARTKAHFFPFFLHSSQIWISTVPRFKPMDTLICRATDHPVPCSLPHSMQPVAVTFTLALPTALVIARLML